MYLDTLIACILQRLQVGVDLIDLIQAIKPG